MNGFEIWNYIAQQSALVMFMSIVIYFGYRLFRDNIKAKDLIIKDKDKQIRSLNDENRADLKNSFKILTDINSVLKEWIIKDHSNKESEDNFKRKLEKTLESIKTTTDHIYEKLNK